jgi:hypothetical protein
MNTGEISKLLRSFIAQTDFRALKVILSGFVLVIV